MTLPFRIREKLGGIFPNMANRKNQLLTEQNKGSQVAELLANKHWPVMERLLGFFREEAVSGLAARNLKPEDSQRFTNRLELLKDVNSRLSSIVRVGIDAEKKLVKMEKNNG